MSFYLPILPEITLLGSSFLILFFLAFGDGSKSRSFIRGLSLLGMSFAAFSTLYYQPTENISLFSSAIGLNPVFVFVRFTLFVVSLLLLLFTHYSEKFSFNKGAEFSFFIVNIAFFSSVLLLSEHALVSFICLSGLMLFSILLSAMSGREGRKISAQSYLQSSVCFCLSFAVLVILSTQLDSLTYTEIKNYIHGLNGLYGVPLIFMLFLPFFCVSALFPFHFIGINRGQNSTWLDQAIQSLLIQGAGVLALIKIVIFLFFMKTETQASTMGLSILMGFTVCGFCGLFYGAFGALAQKNIRCFSAHIVLMQWSSLLVVMSSINAQVLSTIVIQFISISMGLVLYFWILGGLCLSQKKEKMEELCGMGRSYFCFLLLLVLISLAGLPPMMGFFSTLQALGTIFAQSQPVVFSLFLLYLLVQVMIFARLVAVLFFEDPPASTPRADPVIQGTLTRLALVLALLPLLLWGFWGGEFLLLLLKQARLFLIF